MLPYNSPGNFDMKLPKSVKLELALSVVLIKLIHFFISFMRSAVSVFFNVTLFQSLAVLQIKRFKVLAIISTLSEFCMFGVALAGALNNGNCYGSQWSCPNNDVCDCIFLVLECQVERLSMNG